MRQEFIDNRPKAVQQLVQSALPSGLWAERHPGEAADIAARYWNQPPDLIRYALTTPKHRIQYRHYTPEASEIQSLADLMMHYGLIADHETDGLVQDRFARNADLDNIADVDSILR